MPEIKNCKECRRMFQYVTGALLCPVCKQKDEEDFEKVRVFLRDFPGANIQEVADNTEVSPNKISRWLREERLEVSEGSPVAINCENCGVRIRSGRFCIDCSKGLAREMMNAGRELKQSLGESSAKRSSSSNDRDEFGLYYKHREDK